MDMAKTVETKITDNLTSECSTFETLLNNKWLYVIRNLNLYKKIVITETGKRGIFQTDSI